MSSLPELVRGLALREGVEAVVVVSADGLTIDQAGDAGATPDPEALAALTATLVQHAGRLGETVGRGAPATLVLEYEHGLLIAAGVDGGVWLLLLVRSDTNVGPLLYDLRRHRPAIAALL
jgi:predicted regulator of Ras-like GTPase activity (Roadblock/LC7/MglB family)